MSTESFPCCSLLLCDISNRRENEVLCTKLEWQVPLPSFTVRSEYDDELSSDGDVLYDSEDHDCDCECCRNGMFPFPPLL